MPKSSATKLAYMREYNKRPENIERDRFTKLRLNYGISKEQYEELFASQGRRCRLCGGDDAKNRKHASWGVDHCHETGVIRGILCGPCNLLLGHAQESPEILRKAADYLERGSYANR